MRTVTVDLITVAAVALVLGFAFAGRGMATCAECIAPEGSECGPNWPAKCDDDVSCFICNKDQEGGCENEADCVTCCCRGGCGTLLECKTDCAEQFASQTPTLSEYGLILFAVLLLTAGTVVILRRRAVNQERSRAGRE